MGILLFGESGQVGSACVKEAGKQGIDIVALNRSEADFSRPEIFRKLIQKYNPALVINAAAYTAVDDAEDEKDLAFLINAFAPGAIAKACSELDIPIVHISTDYVFDGTSKSAYKESDTTNPINVYGSSKLQGEQLIEDCCEKFIILRTSWVFSAHGSNFVKTMFNLSGRGKLNVVADQYGCPTYAGHIAEMLLNIARKFMSGESVSWGVYHFSGDEKISWCEFSKAIFQSMRDEGVVESIPEVQAIDTDGYPTKAVRPKMTVLDQTKIGSEFQMPDADWRRGLNETITLLSVLSEA